MKVAGKCLAGTVGVRSGLNVFILVQGKRVNRILMKDADGTKISKKVISEIMLEDLNRLEIWA